MKERNINLDLIRFLAILSVISVHFIRNIGFYTVNISGFALSISVFFRTFLMICVPLFLLLTGYLMNKKTLSKKYYLSIIRIIFIFFVAKFIYVVVDYFYFHEIDSIFSVLKSIFNYDNDYSWYVNMYFGLFLIIPFINLIYNNLTSKKQKQILILTLFFLTSLSSLNIKITIIPNWWSDLYPLTYYFIGAYLKEYGFNIKKIYAFCSLILITLSSSFIYLILSSDKLFVAREFNDYRGPFNVIISILVFGLLLNIKIKNNGGIVKKFIMKTSELSFGIYLFSYIVDKIVYNKFNSLVLDINDRFFYCLVIIPIIFLVSFSLSFVFDFIYNKFIHNRIMNKFNSV